jgi:hypothetical protein
MKRSAPAPRSGSLLTAPSWLSGNSLLADVAPERSVSALQCVLVHGEDGEQRTPSQVEVDREIGNSIDFATRVGHLAQDEEDALELAKEGHPLGRRRLLGYMWSLVTLLTAYGDRLMQCPECRRFFVALRTNQAFCESRCASRKSTREYRKRKEGGV